MAGLQPGARRPWALVGALVLLVWALSGCDYIMDALPPSPSPFPTLARLPSVTPVPPTATPLPTRVPRPSETPTPDVTPTLPVLEGTVAVGANVRSGPGTDFRILTSLVVGTVVTIQGKTEDGWYSVVLEDGQAAWMFETVLEVPPDTAELVPPVEYSPDDEDNSDTDE